MNPLPIELDLPLGEPDDGHLGERRLAHLASIPGVDRTACARLARAFPTLAEVYAAPESRLRDVVGPVVAARVRWFLDAPLAVPAPLRPVTPRGLSNAA